MIGGCHLEWGFATIFTSALAILNGTMMKSILQTLAVVTVSLCFSCSAPAAIIVTLTQSGTGVTASWTGSGTVSGGNPASVIEFRNFSGNPFAANRQADILPGLAIGGEDNSSAIYANLYEELEITGAGLNTGDLIFRGSSLTSIQAGFTYDAVTPIPPATISGLAFADLNVGTYTASNSVGDAGDFGGVTLNIVASTAIPEPSTFAGVGLLVGIGFLVRRRKVA